MSATQQIDLFDITDVGQSFMPANDDDIDYGEPDLQSYDYYLVAMSGGKDSLACLLHLIEQGVPLSRIELMHHSVDGKGNPNPLMDWPCTEAYCDALAKAFNLPIYYSWKDGGFEMEMLRENSLTRPTYFETPEGTFKTGGTTGKLSTRRKFPQLAASLNTRWCSAYLKVDPASKAITGQPRFNYKRTLFVTGERAEESSARSKYKTFEPHRTDRRGGRSRRHIDHYRPVHGWSEQEVWDIIARHKVRPHPAYRLGWGRLSCMTCIFGSPTQWKSVETIDPERFERIAQYEEEFGVTIHRKKSVREQIVGKTPYEAITVDLVKIAMSTEYNESIFVDHWELPAGAFGESNGPT